MHKGLKKNKNKIITSKLSKLNQFSTNKKKYYLKKYSEM